MIFDDPAPAALIYFIGITATASSITRIFPRWAARLGLDHCAVQGIDLPKPSAPATYRALLERIRRDERILGAVVTSHKIALFEACETAFDEVDDYARSMGEVSCISKRGERLVGQAKDPITSGLALETFLSRSHWRDTRAEVLVLGAGGAAMAVTLYLTKPAHEKNRPARITVADRSEARLKEMARVHRALGVEVPVAYRLASGTPDCDALLTALPPHSLIINATGLGKDAPGSPLSDRAVFPAESIAWDFNARGDLVFLEQARAQETARGVTAQDGWGYFLYGWTQHLAEILHLELPPRGSLFAALARIAEEERG